MTTSGRNKVLVILVIVLLLTNAGMLYYFTCCGKTKEVGEKPLSRAEQVAKELELDSAQTKEYILLRARRDSVIKPMQSELRAAKLNLLSLLWQNNRVDSAIQASIDSVAAKQKPIEMEYYSHYQRMLALLKPNQIVLFDSVLTRMVRRNTGGDTVK